MKSSMGIAVSVSNRPSVAHWAMTLAPSCSTSRLTSRIRAGLFLIVCTPSGVSVVSMMYVGIYTLLLVVGRHEARLVSDLRPEGGDQATASTAVAWHRLRLAREFRASETLN